jgi:hypothetical protein
MTATYEGATDQARWIIRHRHVPGFRALAEGQPHDHLGV